MKNHSAEKLILLNLTTNSSFYILHSSFLVVPLHPLFEQLEHWRDGRVVDYNGLENRRTERYRGFESLSLRQGSLKPAEFQRVSSFSTKPLPLTAPLAYLSFFKSEAL